MESKRKCTLALVIFTVLLVICKCKILDVEDYTFYFKSFRYQFTYNTITNNNNNNHILVNNDKLKIELINSSFVINNKIILNYDDINNWNEISYIYNNNNNNIQKRNLLNYYKSWNPYDHTTEHHIRSGRFRGESIYKRKFEDARAMCQEFYGDLASIRDVFEDQGVDNLCAQLSGNNNNIDDSKDKKGDPCCWIGLQVNKDMNKWEDTNKWLDGHPLGFTNWAPGEPNNWKGNEQCTQINKDSKWNDIDCNTECYAICEAVTHHQVGNYIGVYKKLSWYKGNLYCKMKYGTQLATIISYEDQMDAKDSCSLVADDFDSEDCWIGMKKYDNLIWKWVDDTMVQYNNWGLGQPDDDNEKECALMNTQQTSAVWQNIKCAEKNWIICNAKPRTDNINMRDILFPKTQSEQKEKENRLLKLQQLEMKEKKMEIALADKRLKKEHQNEQDQNEISDQQNDIKAKIKKYIKKKQNKYIKPKQIDNKDTKNKLRNHIQKEEHNHNNKQRKDRIKTLKNAIKDTRDKHDEVTDLFNNLLQALGGAFGMDNNNNNNDPFSMNDPLKDPFGMNMPPPPFGPNDRSPPPPMGLPEGRYGGKNNIPPPPPQSVSLQRLFPGTIYRNPYANRRRIMDNDYSDISKCIYDIGYEICFIYDIDNDLLTIDVSICDKKRIKQDNDPYATKHRDIAYNEFLMLNKMGDDDIVVSDDNLIYLMAHYLGYNIWKYEEMDYKNSFNNQEIDNNDIVDYGRFNEEDNQVHYFTVFELFFTFNPIKTSETLCQNNDNEEDNLPFNACLKKSEDNDNDIVLFFDVTFNSKMEWPLKEIKTYHYNNDNEWDEIYANIDKKCSYLIHKTVVCITPIDDDNYVVDVKVFESLQ